MLSVLERPTARTTFRDTPTNRFLIERNVPLPPRSTDGRGREPKYPFAHMSVGDSFAVPLSSYGATGKRPVTIEHVMSTVSTCARGYAKRHNAKARFATRKIDETTARVWRTA